jgi:hypothetical protein
VKREIVMRTLWIGGVVVALALLAHGRLLDAFSAPAPKDETKPAAPGLKGEAPCGFLPVAVPGGQGGRDIYVLPEEVIAIRANDVPNKSTSIFFRGSHSIQVSASDMAVLKALQSTRRVRPGDR